MLMKLYSVALCVEIAQLRYGFLPAVTIVRKDTTQWENYKYASQLHL